MLYYYFFVISRSLQFFFTQLPVLISLLYFV